MDSAGPYADAYRRLQRAVQRFLSASGGPVPSLGRGRANIARSLKKGARSPYSFISGRRRQEDSNTVALDVDLDLIALPKVAGAVEPWRVIDTPERAAAAANLSKLERSKDERPSPTIQACHRVNIKEETALAQKLLEAGMAKLMDESAVPVGPGAKLLVGGWFAVAHTRGRQRLVFDRRPQNSTNLWIWFACRRGPSSSTWR